MFLRWLRRGKRSPSRYARPARRRVLLQVEQLEGRTLPSTIVLGPSKDNTIYQNAAAISNGAGSTFIAGETNGLTPLIRRGLIAFDIAGNIPAGDCPHPYPQGRLIFLDPAKGLQHVAALASSR